RRCSSFRGPRGLWLVHPGAPVGPACRAGPEKLQRRPRSRPAGGTYPEVRHLMNDETSVTLTLADRDEAIHLFGHHDHNLRMIKDAFAELKIIARGDTIQITGPAAQVARAERVFEQLRQMLQQQEILSPEMVRTAVAAAGQVTPPDQAPVPLPAIAGTRSVRPRTPGQSRYVTAMRENDLVFAIGPAGTGKTYLAVAVAVTLLRQGAIKKIVLVRPAVDAGE